MSDKVTKSKVVITELCVSVSGQWSVVTRILYLLQLLVVLADHSLLTTGRCISCASPDIEECVLQLSSMTF